jgi:signal transduction histidine kinase/ligand-binding sensor domain-containing protein/DNA-binding response OmpR family regulator
MICKVLKKAKHLHALILPMLLSAQTCFAQMGKLFDANHQLSSNFTNQVFLDNDGFMWAVTRNGLNRYDGYQFRIYKKGSREQDGMASNYVNCMAQDKNGLFYLGMWGSLQTYDGNRFRTIQVQDTQGKSIDCYITCFLVRKNGDVLAGTSGFGILKIDNSGKAHQLGDKMKDIHTVQQMIEDQHGQVWILGRNEGLFCFDGKSMHTYFTESPMNADMRKICETSDGTIWLGTMSQGLFKMENGAFTRVPEAGNLPIAELYANSKGEVMIGYDGAGIGIYNPKTNTLTNNPYYSLEVDLSRSKVYSIAEDKSGNIWLGLLQKGIFMQPNLITEFDYLGYKYGKHNIIGEACVSSTFIDSKGRCWVGTDKDQLYCLDSNHRLIKHYTEGIPGTIMSLAETPDGRIWIGSYEEGFGYLDANGNSWHKLPIFQTASGFSIQASQTGDIWIATMGQGLLRLDANGNLKKAYTTTPNAASEDQQNRITNDYISKISLSPDGKRLYVATTMGVCCLDIEEDSWINTFGKNCLNYGTPSRIVKEYDGQLWIGTNDGLFHYDLTKKDLKLYTTAHGLADNGIASIEQDKQGRLWIGTDHGLCCLDPKTGLTQSYFVDDGLQSNEFSDGASYAINLSDRCVMIFGGVGGISWFHPERVKQTQWDAKVSLVSFIVNRNAVSSNSMSEGYQICDTTVIAANRFQLASHDNNFAIQFSTLTYDNPEHVTYLYSINGENYIRLQPGINEITFTHLPPGTYRFRVKAERNNIETPEKSFTVIIHSPWYRSAWAYCLYLMVAGIALWQIILTRRRREQNRLRLQEHIHAEEMSDAKLRFFMNISHEIRTPMTLIVTPLLSLIKNESDPHRKSVYETIKRNAERILSLINQMMDLRKIDKGQMQMRMTETNLIAFVKDIYDLFENQAKTKTLTLTYEHDADELPVWVDRRNFDKVIMNILSNAFKFTPSGGHIDIRITHDDEYARISISDDGEKIPEDKLDKIFERFYQTASTINDRHVGTGIGLDLTRSLVELHHGTIEARNLDKGCEFIVTIPMGNSHLRPDEIEEVRSQETGNGSQQSGTEDKLLFEEMEEMLHPEESIVEHPNNRRLTIVIAEDDTEISDYLDSELSRDYDVRVCENGRVALSETLRTIPDLVISDIMMPEMDGNALCSKLKSNPSTNFIPVILLTAKNRDEDKLEGLETGADAYIVKPFNMDILRRTIINLINSHRLMRLKYGRNDDLEEKVADVKMKSPDQKLLERVMTSINSHLNDSDLSVDMIAEEVGISRVHLHRKMKELTGQTPHDFIRNIRLKQAANLLANQGMNVTEVMYACGFSNSASFSTVFKKFYGMSPRDYMKEHYKQGH